MVNQVSEDCDPPDDAACVDECQPNCTCPGAEPRCGDGTINQPSEQCDDGNTQNGDCCSASCQFESCDDGNACTDDSCNPASGCFPLFPRPKGRGPIEAVPRIVNGPKSQCISATERSRPH